MPCRIARLNYTIFHGLVLVFGTSIRVSTYSVSSFVTFLLSFPHTSKLLSRCCDRIILAIGEFLKKIYHNRSSTNLIPSKEQLFCNQVWSFSNSFKLKLGLERNFGTIKPNYMTTWDYQRGIKVLFLCPRTEATPLLNCEDISYMEVIG